MKIHFEKVGRDERTWDAEYPREVSLEAACENVSWWVGQLRGAMRSDPDWTFDPATNRVKIYAGWHCIGQAWVAEEVAR